MKKIDAVNASPRKGWNTDTIVTEAAKGAESAGAHIEKFDLYRAEKFTGCISCFGCKKEILLIMTSNASDNCYTELMNKYKAVFESFIGPTEILTIGQTMQVSDYSQFNWIMFDAADRKLRRETIFPKECKKAFEAGVRLMKAAI